MAKTPKRKRRPRRPRWNRWAKWGTRGGFKRAQALTPERRREIAQAAARARWGTPEPTPEPA